jgi:fatty acid desaturase
MLEWSIIALAIGLAGYLGTWWAAVVAFMAVATRQHALLILYHDAVHGHFSRIAWVNDFIVNVSIGVPMLMPVELYRPLHIEHHQAIGTDLDPERQLLYASQAWDYRPLPFGALVRQLFGDLFVVNGIRTIAAWRKTRPFPPIRAQTMIVATVWLAALGLWLIIAPRTALVALVLWLAPLLTLTQLLQKLRSYAEHSGGPGLTPGWEDWTYSWRIGLLGRLTIWPYHINYHREHHERPDLHWHQLPAIVASDISLTGRSFWRILSQPVARQARY